MNDSLWLFCQTMDGDIRYNRLVQNGLWQPGGSLEVQDCTIESSLTAVFYPSMLESSAGSGISVWFAEGATGPQSRSKSPWNSKCSAVTIEDQ